MEERKDFAFWASDSDPDDIDEYDFQDEASAWEWLESLDDVSFDFGTITMVFDITFHKCKF